jgi:hypothetical protein
MIHQQTKQPLSEDANLLDVSGPQTQHKKTQRLSPMSIMKRKVLRIKVRLPQATLHRVASSLKLQATMKEIAWQQPKKKLMAIEQIQQQSLLLSQQQHVSLEKGSDLLPQKPKAKAIQPLQKNRQWHRPLQ